MVECRSGARVSLSTSSLASARQFLSRHAGCAVQIRQLLSEIEPGPYRIGEPKSTEVELHGGVISSATYGVTSGPLSGRVNNLKVKYGGMQVGRPGGPLHQLRDRLASVYQASPPPGDTPPYKVTPVILHGVESPDRARFVCVS